jgi:hypothetical protein
MAPPTGPQWPERSLQPADGSNLLRVSDLRFSTTWGAPFQRFTDLNKSVSLAPVNENANYSQKEMRIVRKMPDFLSK